MYFLFVVLWNDDESEIGVLMLERYATITFQQPVKLHLMHVDDDIATAHDRQRRFVRQLQAQAKRGEVIKLEADTDDLHFVWIMCDPTSDGVKQAGAPYELAHSVYGLSVELQPGQKFSVVLATYCADEAEELCDNPPEDFATIAASGEHEDEPGTDPTDIYEA